MIREKLPAAMNVYHEGNGEAETGVVYNVYKSLLTQREEP